VQTLTTSDLELCMYTQLGEPGKHRHWAPYMVPKTYCRVGSVAENGNELHVIPLEDGGFTIMDRYRVYGHVDNLLSGISVVPESRKDEYIHLMKLMSRLLEKIR
jgi:hypothetical protein